MCVALFKMTFRSRVRKKKEIWFQIYLVLEDKTNCASFFFFNLTFFIRALRFSLTGMKKAIKFIIT